MSAISLKSITGITSITTPAGVDNQLTLHTNNTTERFRIDSSGRVMIGNTNASTMFGGADDLVVGTTSGGRGITIISQDNSIGRILFSDSLSQGAATYQGQINYNHSAEELDLRTYTSGSITLSTSNTERLRITSSGQVGIGTDNPFYTTSLDVFDGSSGTDEDLFSVRSKTGAFLIQCSDKTTSNPEWRLRTFAAEDLVFSPGGTGAAGEKVRIKHDGNVGIGSAIPSQLLDIGGNTTVASNGRVNIYRPTSGSTNTAFQINSNVGGTDTTQFIIQADGAVGIGTNSPDGKLDVRGTIFVNGDATGGRIFASGGNLSLTDGNGRQTLRIDDPGSGNTHTHVFNSSGHLGVGDNNPDTRLSVTAASGTDVVGKFTSTDANAWIQFRDNTTTDTAVMVGANGDDLLLRAGSNERLRIKSGGNIKFATNNSASDYLEWGGNPRLWLRCPSNMNGLRIDASTTPLEIKNSSNNGKSFSFDGNFNFNVNGDYSLSAGEYDSSGKIFLNATRHNGSTTVTSFQTSIQAVALSDTNNDGYLGLGASAHPDDLVIKTDGNIGIGITNPENNLVVKNPANSGHTVSAVLSGDSTTKIISMVVQGSEGRLGMSSDHDLAIYAGQLERVRIDKDGMVKMGTAGDPTDILDVHKDSTTAYDATDDNAQKTHSASITIRNDNGTTNTFSQLVFDTAGSNQSIARIVALRTGTASNALTFVTEHSNTKAERLRITSDGKIGIGTDNPTYKIHVDSGDAAIGLWKSRRSSGSYIEYAVGANGAALGYIGAGGQIISSAGADSGDFAIRSQGDLLFSSGGSVERLRIDPNGNALFTANQVKLYNATDNSNTYFYAQNTGAGNAGVRIKNQDGEWTIIANDSLRFRDEEASADKLSIPSTGGIQISAIKNVSATASNTTGSFSSAELILTTPAYAEYHYTWSGQASYTIDLTCASYFHSEFIYVQHQTNGGTGMQTYIRGKWANNHRTHTCQIHEWYGSVNGLDVTFVASDQSGNGAVNGEDGLTAGGWSSANYRGLYGGGGDKSDGSSSANGRLRINETYNWGSVSTRALIVRVYMGSFAISKS